MKSWKIEPKNSSVAQFVQCYWLLEKEVSDTSHNYPKLNPDPSGTLIIAPAQHPYHYQNSANIFAGNGSHWIFPNSQTLQLDHSQPFVILGIKFNVGALYSCNLSPKQPIIDQVITEDVNALLQTDKLNDLRFLVDDNLPENACRDLLDKALSSWLSKYHQDSHSKLCQKALIHLSNTPVSDIGKLLHCSQRTIERSFSRVTGFTLKQCQSMNRFEAILERLYSLNEEEIDWLDIVDEFDFSDQPHLIRYLKSFIGETPSNYVKERDLTIDIYGDFNPD